MEAPHRSILLLDDDPQLCEIIVLGLSEAGYAVTSVANSMECLDLLDGGRSFDLMIIDIMMRPGTPHGLSVGRMVRARSPWQKIIYITGRAGELPDGFLEDSDAPVIAKPFHFAELLHTVERVLARAPAR